MSTVIKGGTLVSSGGLQIADILIEGEKISRIAPELPGYRVVDASGCLVFPGFIDAHTHLEMPVSGTVTADSFQTGTAAAIAGGTTTILDFATQDKGGSLQQALDVWHSRADGHCSCDYGFHMAICDWNENTRSQLREMAAAGVTSFKCYLAYDALMVSDAQLYDILTEMKKIGGVLGVHCENGPVLDLLRERAVRSGALSPAWHPRTRPALLEGEAVSRFLRLAGLAGVPSWVVHLSTVDGLEEIRLARRRGQTVYVESCPQYFTLDERLYESPGFEGAKYVCSPPLRSREDQAALWEALSAEEIDLISTDHCSFNFKGQKELGLHDFTLIPNGMPGIEHRAAVMYTAGVASGRISVQELCRLLSETPAKLFGLYPKKGLLAPGSDADIAIYDPRRDGLITAARQYQNCDYSPYEGFKTSGSLRDVFLRGAQVFKDGELILPGTGRYLSRGQAFRSPE